MHSKAKSNKEMEIQGRIAGNQVHNKKIIKERCYKRRKLLRGLLQQQRTTCSLKSFYDCLVKAYVYCKTPRLSRALANPSFLSLRITACPTRRLWYLVCPHEEVTRFYLEKDRRKI